ncbi:uncharacterized protein KD926_002453 [Aspergillus affinis]|uniref:uncharacterized protein n=1 Tax=Aspergillus affinis TaxID=1070780 RepID=UPI0022FF2B63|nr:uncharacterized protein KD926_002453 [Aspergillus affinis]KAI9036076.1 hypothetical protein KD926_002453 [Aspergillus affinis]
MTELCKAGQEGERDPGNSCFFLYLEHLLPTFQPVFCLQSSNSTASMFVGGVRRLWMDNPPVPRPPAAFPPSSSPAASALIPAAAANATATAPPVDPSRAGMQNLVRVPVASSPSTCRIQQNDGVPSSPQPPPQPHPQSQSQPQLPLSQSPSDPSPSLPPLRVTQLSQPLTTPLLSF